MRERENNHREDESVLVERSRSVKMQVEALEALLGPEDVDVDLRRILKEGKDLQGRMIFETFSSNDMRFLVAEVQMGQIKKSAMETRSVGFRKRWMVASKLETVPGTADCRLEPNCKKMLFGKLRPSHRKS